MRKRLILAMMTIGTVCAADPDLRVPEAEAKKAAIHKTAPAYPATARQLNVSGRIELEATVGLDGSVEAVKIVSGNLILTKAGVDAVKQWRFRPFTVDGKPVRAIASLSFDFRQ